MNIELTVEQRALLTLKSLKEDYEYECAQRAHFGKFYYDKKILKALRLIISQYMTDYDYDDYMKKVKNAHRSK